MILSQCTPCLPPPQHTLVLVEIAGGSVVGMLHVMLPGVTSAT